MAKRRPSRVLSLHITIPATRSGGLLDWFVQRLVYHSGVNVTVEGGSMNGSTRHVYVTANNKEELYLLQLAARVNAADWCGTGVDVIH